MLNLGFKLHLIVGNQDHTKLMPKNTLAFKRMKKMRKTKHNNTIEIQRGEDIKSSYYKKRITNNKHKQCYWSNKRKTYMMYL